MCSKIFFMEIKILLIQRNSVGTDKENVVPGNLCIIWKLNEAWPLKKDSVTFLRLLKLLKLKGTPPLPYDLKFLILKKEPCHFLTNFKVFNTEKGHHHCLKVFNTEIGLRHFFRTLKVFNIEKELHHFLETPKAFNFEKWLHHILKTLQVFQSSYSVECWTVTSEGRLSCHIYD